MPSSPPPEKKSSSHQVPPVVERPGREEDGAGGLGKRVEPLGAPDDNRGAASIPPDPGARRQDGAEQQHAALVVGHVRPGEGVGEEGVQLGVLRLVVGVVGLERIWKARTFGTHPPPQKMG